jgi:ParB-like nuclease family protein
MTDIEMVSVAELLKKITSTADGFFPGDDGSEWFRMMEYKGGEVQTPAIIRAIERYGFTDPICITAQSDNNWELGNGHHRLVIAILLGLDEIPVDFSEWYSRASTSNQQRIYDDELKTDDEMACWIAEGVKDSVYTD